MLKNQTERPTPAAARTETPGARRPARVPRDAPGSSGGGQPEGRPGALTAGCLLTGLGPRGFMVSGRQVRNATSAGNDLFLWCNSSERLNQRICRESCWSGCPPSRDGLTAPHPSMNCKRDRTFLCGTSAQPEQQEQVGSHLNDGPSSHARILGCLALGRTNLVHLYLLRHT
jgi:hypothetical protein